MEPIRPIPTLRRGAHPSRNDGMCAMEMVAWLAGEAHSDEPECACPVIAAFVRAWNDALTSDAAREQWLRPLVTELVNTRASAAIECERGFLIADAVLRRFVPLILARRGREHEAALLRSLPRLRSPAAIHTGLRALSVYAPDLHAAKWVLQRAVDGAPPARYAAGAIQVARTVAGVAAWNAAAELVRSLLAAGPRSKAAVAPARRAEAQRVLCP